MATRARFGLCTGKDCRRADGFAVVARELGRAGAVRELPCLDVCDGPVVVIDVAGDAPVVIARVRTKAMASELTDHVTAGVELSGRLRKRILTGSKRSKARRRLTRAMSEPP